MGRSRDQLSRIQESLRELQIDLPTVAEQSDTALSDAHLEVRDSPNPVEFDGLSPEVVRALQSAFGDLAKALPPQAVFDLIQSILSRITDRLRTPDPEAPP